MDVWFILKEDLANRGHQLTIDNETPTHPTNFRQQNSYKTNHWNH